MEIRQSKIPGCYELVPKIFEDQRGRFIKTFHKNLFEENHLETCFAEEYYSISHQNVLRGLHFQRPPHDHTKLVYCVQGEVMDVVVDLRVGSPTYGEVESFQVSDLKANLIYIPPGLAHGFYVISDRALMVYKVSTVYAPEHDTGIRWDSVDISWPSTTPIISERDRGFQSLSEFKSPFIFKD